MPFLAVCLTVFPCSTSPNAVHVPNRNTNSDEDRVEGIGPGSPIIYLLYSSTTGAQNCHTEEQHRAIFDALVGAMNVITVGQMRNRAPPPPGAIVYEEQAGEAPTTEGWSNSRTTNANSNGFVHGPWGNDVRSVSRDFIIGAPATCTVSFTMWSIDSTDNEWNQVTINDEIVWRRRATYSSGFHDGIPGNGNERGNPDFPQYWGGNNDIWREDVSVDVECFGTLTMVFSSWVDQNMNDGEQGDVDPSFRLPLLAVVRYRS
eukprot:SAG22_NODE_1136_length_5395_cov_2.101189_2_plen_260_part_00